MCPGKIEVGERQRESTPTIRVIPYTKAGLVVGGESPQLHDTT